MCPSMRGVDNYSWPFICCSYAEGFVLRRLRMTGMLVDIALRLDSPPQELKNASRAQQQTIYLMGMCIEKTINILH